MCHLLSEEIIKCSNRVAMIRTTSLRRCKCVHHTVENTVCFRLQLDELHPGKMSKLVCGYHGGKMHASQLLAIAENYSKNL